MRIVLLKPRKFLGENSQRAGVEIGRNKIICKFSKPDETGKCEKIIDTTSAVARRCPSLKNYVQP